ncbi:MULTISPECIES: DUF5947 family protein [Streptomyces]|uniref:DUF5947 family protein n=1 Tax=Streptomyces TaxID=1883 RepID=UPI00025CE54D|nr:DUF5947 family protein [Streptomyces tsukubensis]EIF88340.1 hypothetical protein [Streptomyces tsukubensis NRRL18488]
MNVRRLDRTGTGVLRALRAPAPPRPERCAFCGTGLAPGHRHLADTADRALVCSCPPCALLLERPGAGGGRYQGLPGRVVSDPGQEPDAGLWAELRIPVSTAFVLRNSALGRPVLCYPSPAGATESELDDRAWQRLLAESRLAAALRPDVEALLLHRTRDPAGGERTAGYLVPVDRAYELVGRMRLLWRGFDGGAEARAALDAFFAALAAEAAALPHEPNEPSAPTAPNEPDESEEPGA